MIEIKLPTGETKQIKGVLFDNDGTLVDTRDLILASMHHATKVVLGREYSEEEYMAGVGTPLESQMLDFANGDQTVADRLTSVYREHNHAAHDRMIGKFDGIADTLSKLKAAGVSLGVVTSKRHALAWHGLEITGLSGYFDFLIGPDDCAEHKPKPGPILEGCKRMGLDPSECVYVGDSPYDIQAGNAAGCATAAVLWGVFPREALAADAPDFFCSNAREMTAVFGL